jgi:site-specific DNA-adenine methylase
MTGDLHAPFPWFGGKRRVADVVWKAFGQEIANYCEPFAGSLAVLIGRPGGAGKIETVNDRNRYLANFWRAVTADPAEVARHADWPVN